MFYLINNDQSDLPILQDNVLKLAEHRYLSNMRVFLQAENANIAGRDIHVVSGWQS